MSTLQATRVSVSVPRKTVIILSLLLFAACLLSFFWLVRKWPLLWAVPAFLPLAVQTVGAWQRRVAVRRFTRQLAMLLRANMPLLEAITLVGYQGGGRRWERVIGEVIESLRLGKSFWEALKRHAGYFDERYVESIRFAERHGDPQDLVLALHLLIGELSYTPPPQREEREEPYLDFYARRRG